MYILKGSFSTLGVLRLGGQASGDVTHTKFFLRFGQEKFTKKTEAFLACPPRVEAKKIAGADQVMRSRIEAQSACQRFT